jgi:hypothetical protein
MATIGKERLKTIYCKGRVVKITMSDLFQCLKHWFERNQTKIIAMKKPTSLI